MILQTPHFVYHLIEETNDLSGNVLASGEERVSKGDMSIDRTPFTWLPHGP
jgi:hypothetical protein